MALSRAPVGALQTVDVNTQGVPVDQVSTQGVSVDPEASTGAAGLSEAYEAADEATKVEKEVAQKGSAAIDAMSQHEKEARTSQGALTQLVQRMSARAQQALANVQKTLGKVQMVVRSLGGMEKAAKEKALVTSEAQTEAQQAKQLAMGFYHKAADSASKAAEAKSQASGALVQVTEISNAAVGKTTEAVDARHQ